MTKDQVERAFNGYVGFLHQIADISARRTGRGHEECYQQACYLFVAAQDGYDKDHPAGAAFCTYAMTAVRNGMMKWCHKNPLAIEDDLLKPVPAPAALRPDRALMRKEWLENLRDEVREVIMLVLNGPAETMGLDGPVGRWEVRGAITRHLRKQGWSHPRIWKAMKEARVEVTERMV